MVVAVRRRHNNYRRTYRPYLEGTGRPGPFLPWSPPLLAAFTGLSSGPGGICREVDVQITAWALRIIGFWTINVSVLKISFRRNRRLKTDNGMFVSFGHESNYYGFINIQYKCMIKYKKIYIIIIIVIMCKIGSPFVLEMGGKPVK